MDKTATVFGESTLGEYSKYDGVLYIKTYCDAAMAIIKPGPDKQFRFWEIVEPCL